MTDEGSMDELFPGLPPKLPVQRFRKKPVVIEARQVTVHEHADVAAWCGGTATYAYVDSVQVPDGVLIKTLEGVMNARHGDWIIKGVQGEFYPCKPGIFAETYEPAAGEPSPVTEFAVCYGGEDPNDCTGRLTYAGEDEARETAQRITGAYVARCEVTRTRWERVGEVPPDGR